MFDGLGWGAYVRPGFFIGEGLKGWARALLERVDLYGAAHGGVGGGSRGPIQSLRRF